MSHKQFLKQMNEPEWKKYNSDIVYLQLAERKEQKDMAHMNNEAFNSTFSYESQTRWELGHSWEWGKLVK